MIWRRSIVVAALAFAFAGTAQAGEAVLTFLGGGKTIEVSAADVLSVELSENSYGDPTLYIEFTEEIGAALEANTSRWIGKKLIVKFGQKTLMRPTVYEPITGGRLTVSGPEQAELQDLFEALTNE